MASRIAALFLKPGHGQPMAPVESIQAVENRGLRGDASFGRRQRQILLVEGEMLDRFGLQAGQIRENIVVRGFPLSGVSVGQQLQVGEARFEITAECTPCDRMDAVRPGLQEAIRGQRGLLAKVIGGGNVRIGDSVRALGKQAGHSTLAD